MFWLNKEPKLFGYVYGSEVEEVLSSFSKSNAILTATPLFSSSWKTFRMGTEKQSESWHPLCWGSEGVMMRT